jgi:iron complex outermembrane receptor protein
MKITPLRAAILAVLGGSGVSTLETAWAQERSSGGIEEIIVTTEFREANVQDTPVAITAVNADMLDARNQTNLVQISAQAPNVTLTPWGQAGGKAMLAFIRGVGQTDFNYALEPGVGIYVDEVYYPNLTGSMLELVDIDRVEIMRGPQGTLSGRNSIGGAIKIFSQDADISGGNRGTAELVVGDFNRVDVRGSADFTFIDDKLAARVSGVSRNRDGYVTRYDYKCLHPTSPLPTFSNGDLENCELGQLGGESFTAGRVSLLWTPNDNLAIKVIGDITNEHSETAPSVLLRVDEPRQAPGLGSPAAPPFAPNGAVGPNPGTFIDLDGDLSTTGDREYYDNRFVTYGPFREDTVLNDGFSTYSTFLDPMPTQPTRPFSPVGLDPRTEFDDQGISVQIDWDMTDSLSLKWISAMREYRDLWSEDRDGSPMNVQMLTQFLEHEHSTHEVRLNGTGLNDRLDYTVGAFYVDQNKATHEANVNLHYAQLNFIHGPDETPSDSTAIFLHTAWHLTDDLNLTLGYRKTEDHKEYRYRRRNPDGTLPAGCIAGPPANIVNPPNCALAGLFFDTNPSASGVFDSDRGDYRVALDYHIGDNFMVYGQVSTGYKAGGINPRPFFLIQIEQFAEEEIESQEIGFKSTLADGTVRFNAAIFANDYQDIQLSQVQCELPFPPFFGAPCIQPGNVGDADVDGIELEVEVRPTDRFWFDMSYANLDFQYTRLDSVSVPNVTSDMVAPYTPETKWSFGVQYDWPLANGGSLSARLDTVYTDDMYANSTNAPTNLIENYTLSSARLTWTGRNGWEAALEVTNLTDEYYFLNIFDQYTSTAGQVSAGPGTPRMWAMHLKRDFDFE